jgi:flagellar hook-basal body complex protein FliE
MVDSISANAAYKKIAGMQVDKLGYSNLKISSSDNDSDSDSGSDSGSGVNFAELLGKTFKEAQSSMLSAENASVSVASNQRVDMSQVVTAVNEAEFVLQTIVTVRDKIISAYQDIMRMQV